jgi:hypothetical protein
MTPEGAGAGEGAEGSRLKHAFATPGAGSPKTALVQSTPPVNCLGLVKVPFAPYTTSRVSLKEQRPPSLAQKVHDESGGEAEEEEGEEAAAEEEEEGEGAEGLALGAETTTAVAAEVAAAEPFRLLAVTMTRNVRPRSAEARP